MSTEPEFVLENDNGSWTVAHRGYSPFVEFDYEDDARAYLDWRNAEHEARSDSVDAFIRDALPGLLAEAVSHVTMFPNWQKYGTALATKVRELHSERKKEELDAKS